VSDESNATLLSTPTALNGSATAVPSFELFPVDDVIFPFYEECMAVTGNIANNSKILSHLINITKVSQIHPAACDAVT
jgi:hypothetical protein